MKFNRLFGAVAVTAALFSTAAQAEVLTFEDLPSGRDWFTSTYHGFNFGNNNSLTNDWFWTNGLPDANDPSPDPGYNFYYTPHSASHVVAVDAANFTGTGMQAAMAITSTSAVIFHGAYFSDGYYLEPGTTYGDTIQYQLYLGGTLVYTSALSSPLTYTPSYVASGYAGLVDRIVVIGNPGYYAMDDFTYEAAAVPEPASVALALTALGAAGIVRRRRRSAR